MTNNNNNNSKIEIKTRERRKRAELNMPNMNFHQWEVWRTTLGINVFDAWLTLYTLADRKTYPNQHIIHHWDYDGLAKKFCCGRTKTVEYIKTLYEYGLIEISETRNEKGGPKNIFIWCDVPFYSDTQYCNIYKARDWKNRKTEGQKRCAAMIEAREKSSSESELDKCVPISSSKSELEGETSSKNELDTSTESELDNNQFSDPSSSESELNNQFRLCTIYNYTNNNNLNDDMMNDKGHNSESERENTVEEQQSDEESLIDSKEIVQYYFSKFGEQEQIVPYIYKWVDIYGKELVGYMIDRLAEQEQVTSVIRWMETALKKPDKYPPKITIHKNTSGSKDSFGVDLKRHIRTKYDFSDNGNHHVEYSEDGQEKRTERQKLYDALLMS